VSIFCAADNQTQIGGKKTTFYSLLSLSVAFVGVRKVNTLPMHGIPVVPVLPMSILLK